MKSLAIISLLATASAFASTTTLKVKGMHCSGCVKMVTKSVCDDPEIKKAYGGCTVKLVDEKNEIGEITFKIPDEKQFNSQKIQTLLTATDDGYKIIDTKTK